MKVFSNLFLLVIILGLSQAGCQTLREIANLRHVSFSLSHVTEARLAGVDVQRIRNYNQLSTAELLRLGAAVARKEAPFRFNVHIEAENPAENSVQARLVKMDWTLFIDDKESISGSFDQAMILPPGEPRDVSIPIEVDLVQLIGQNLPDLVDLALAVTGQGGAPKRIAIKAIPTIDTALGPLRYPQAVTIVSKEVGGTR